MLTRQQRRKLAQAARALAGEYAEGRGPAITNRNSWCGCLAGAVVQRAKGYTADEISDRWAEAAVLEDYAPNCGSVLTDATYAHHDDGLIGAPVFPLLWLADELEAQDG